MKKDTLTQEELVKQMAIELAKVREAFILEELKPYYEYKNNKIRFKQEMKLRLAEIQDFKDSLQIEIRKAYNHNFDNDYVRGFNNALTFVMMLLEK